MLHLQRASAGSGKTFELAKTYIKYFIGKRDDNGKLCLRSIEELQNAHSHILAITFTNKATKEMRRRIVDKLAALATETKNNENRPDYLDDFIKEFGVDQNTIQKHAAVALKTMLMDYSDFQISTIDSFFQLILRTFANETDLNENYQIELDDKLLAKTGVDYTLSQVKDTSLHNQQAETTRHWLNMVINESFLSGERPNPFSKSSNIYSKSIYSMLLQFVTAMSREKFKNIQDSLKEYFRTTPNFIQLYNELLETANNDIAESSDNAIKRCKYIKSEFQKASLSIADTCYVGFSTLLDAVESGALHIRKCDIKLTKNSLNLKTSKKLFKSLADKNGILSKSMPGVIEAASEMVEYVEQWMSKKTQWSITMGKLHYLGILQILLDNIRLFREEHNIIPLSETNSILNRIINYDDTPFIYEKTGTYLNHFLIDEFQDTSHLQWDNIRPLLMESSSRNCDNLIIGDIKQSIYRFRGAEPRLIELISVDPTIEVIDNSNKNNTNWRSANEIVRFNNTFFTLLSAYCTTSLAKKIDINKIYGNVAQSIRHTDMPGYIELNYTNEDVYAKMGPLVRSIINRGNYEQSDITFIVETNEDGKRLIKAISEYNETCSEKEQINIISEESLSIGDSKAIKIIIAILEVIAGSSLYSNDNEAESDGGCKQQSSIDEFVCYYNYYMSKTDNASADDAIESYMNEKIEIGNIDHRLSSMQSMALPAIIEAIAEIFIDEKMRNDQAAYIAAFQDLVLDYCEVYPSDIASLLNWWYSTGSKFSISSPEDSKAVRIMTIHKSKGLEFKCVIMPKADISFSPGKNAEMLWLKPQLPDCAKHFNAKLPEYIPIESSSKLIDTPYSDSYNQFVDNVLLDSINKTYVAFTRAECELYLFFPKCNGKSDKLLTSLGDISHKLLCDMKSKTIGDDINNKFIDRDKLFIDDRDCDNICITYGNALDIRNKQTNNISSARKIGSYSINLNTSILKTTTELNDNEFNQTIHAGNEEKRFGNVMHSIMSSILTANDIDRAFNRAKVKGYITNSIAIKWQTKIKELLSQKPMVDWFKSDLKVMNERTLILRSGQTIEQYRPDRVVVDSNNCATIIDFKFGNSTNEQYAQQVRGYISLLQKTGKYSSVRGFLWYVAISPDTPIEIF